MTGSLGICSFRRNLDRHSAFRQALWDFPKLTFEQLRQAGRVRVPMALGWVSLPKVAEPMSQ